MKAFLGIFFSIILMGSLIGATFFETEASPKITDPGFANKNPREIRCSDFHARKDAQNFFDSYGGKNGHYIELDHDNDGKACEGL